MEVNKPFSIFVQRGREFDTYEDPYEDKKLINIYLFRGGGGFDPL